MKPTKKTLLLLIFMVSLSSIFFLTDHISNLDNINLKDVDEFEKKHHELPEIYPSDGSLPNIYNFKYYKVITLNHTKVSGLNNLSNFPVLISIFDKDLHDDVQSDGDDIAFANDTSWLDHELELFNQDFNTSHAQLIAWVRIPLLSVSVDTNITMYYGNPYIASQENPTGVWDDNYKGVWHMKEVNAIDSTSNNNDGTQEGGVSNLEGKIAGSNYFEGINDLITIGNVGSGIKTIEFWMNPSNLGSLDPITETSWKNPSATGDDYDDWNDPMYAFTSNDSYSIGAPDDYQDWYNFTFNIPNGATINGIELEIEASHSSPVEATIALSWDGGSNYTVYSETKTWIEADDDNVTFGGPINYWERTWSSEELNNNNFRVRLQRSSQATGTLAVDCISVKVYYNYEFMRIIDLDGISRIEIVEEKLLTTNFPGTPTIYIDGVVNSSLTAEWHYIVITNSLGLDVSAMKIGKVSTDYFEGKIDELRVSNISRTPESFNTSYYNQNDPTSFYNINQEISFNIDPPIYSNLTESSNILELGETEIISINITDPSGIRQVEIEFESSNHSMTNIGGDIWRYDLWTPSHADNYSYTIYMEDNCGIWNSVNNSILVVDTTSPTYSNLIESPNPLELGDNVIISVNASDISGINSVIIEFEGSNHSMVNIGGNSWQYDLWTPSHTGNHNYIIFIEDNNNHTISIINNIIVQDTTPPLPPILIHAPSDGINGTLTFDWEGSFDYSGISYYILIIDNESVPFTTPGFIAYINITNTGPESSYYEFSDNLIPGTYYYFICQIDGVGQQSDFLTGSFAITNNNDGKNNFTILDMLPYILASVIGSVTVIVLVKRRIQNRIQPQRKKISLKAIISHINKISNVKPFFKREEQEEKPDDLITSKKETIEERELKNRLNVIKALGEELFDEGAYLEAQKQFKEVEELFLKLGNSREAASYSKLIIEIDRLNKEREIKLELLEQEKLEEHPTNIIALYFDLIDIAKRLNDSDAVKMYQSEMERLFNTKKLRISDFEHKRDSLEKQADLLLNRNHLEKAIKLYENCEEISRFLVKIGREEENFNLKKFIDKKNECIRKITL